MAKTVIEILASDEKRLQDASRISNVTVKTFTKAGDITYAEISFRDAASLYKLGCAVERSKKAK